MVYVAHTNVSLVAHMGEDGAPPYFVDPSTNGYSVCGRVTIYCHSTRLAQLHHERLILRKSIILDIYGESGMNGTIS